MSKVLDISVPSGQSTASHRSHVVRMSVTLNQFVPHIISVVRIEAPLQKLVAQTVLKNGRTQHVSNTDSLLLSVLASRSFVPIPRNEVAVQTMAQIDPADDDRPHSEGAVTVDGIFLEISIHFI